VKILLKIVAVIVGLAVLRTVLMIFQFASSSRLAALIGSGAFGVTTIAAWCLILVAGPVASVQLWRLRRIGLYVAASLSALALLYYLFGSLANRGPELRLAPLVVPIVGNALVVAVLLSPSARRVCS
jgi:hypothetical protein